MSAKSISLIGEAACALLSPGSRGKVLASLSQAIYLVDQDEELVWLTNGSVPLHRRGMRINGPLPSIAVATEFEQRAGRLEIGPKVSLDLAAAEVWHAPCIPAEKILPVSVLCQNVVSTYRHFLAWSKPPGTGNLLPWMLRSFWDCQDCGQIHLLESAGLFRPIVQDMLVALRRKDEVLFRKEASRLVGLGPGLTPAGDDFLGGLFFCLTMLRSALPDLDFLVSWNYVDFIVRSKHLTHLISFHLLKDHAAGYAAEPLHTFMYALLLGAPIEETLLSASQLVTLGHSTGWDVLTGSLAGFSVICS